jgi:DNA-binding transcriptional LysR family regulator
VESKWLEDYLALVKHGSFTRAAEARHVTQPAFSRRIRALENWLGIDLVDRNAYPAKLTSSGETLHHEMQALLDQIVSLQTKASGLSDKSDSIVVATQHALSVSVCPQWFQSIRPLLNRHSLRVNAGNMHDCVDQFVSGKADLLLSYHNAQADPLFTKEGLHFLPLGDDPLVPIATQSFAETYLRASDTLRALPLIGFPNESFLGQVIHQLITTEKQESQFDSVYITAQSESVHELARQGLGMAWLPKSLVKNDLEKGTLAVLPLPSRSLEIRLYWREADQRSVIRNVVDHTKNTFTLHWPSVER